MGAPGAGKTTALKELKEEIKGKDVYGFFCATTNSAAQELGGVTIHSFLNIPIKEEDRRLSIQKIENSFLSSFFSQAQSVGFIIIDEAFILDSYTLDCVYEGLFEANKRLIARGYNPIQLILCGDPAQLLSFKEGRFYKSSIFKEDIPVFELEGLYRQSNSQYQELWRTAINSYRRQGSTQDIQQWLKKTNCINPYLEYNPSHSCFTIAFTNKQVDEINLRTLLEYCESNNKPFYEDRKINLFLAEGAPVVYTSSLKKQGIFKRTRDVINSISHIPNKKLLIIKTNKGEFKHVIGGNDVPFKLAYAGTIHMSQGATFDKVQVLLSDLMKFTPGAGLVSLTRHSKNLQLVGKNIKGILDILKQGIDKDALAFLNQPQAIHL